MSRARRIIRASCISALYVIDMKAGQIRPLANGYDRFADWSPSLAATIQPR